MIRWNPAGKHIIIERPEQLTLHVLPSVYRQSRFASFSRQLHVSPPYFLLPAPSVRSYLRLSADLWLHTHRQPPQIRPRHRRSRRLHVVSVFPCHSRCQLLALTACMTAHPTLNRHSPPEVVKNFKRRVPPRLPKPRKRVSEQQIANAAPRSPTGLGSGVHLSTLSDDMDQSYKASRDRGSSAPDSYTPLPPQPGNSLAPKIYSRQCLPPLIVPYDPSFPHGMYSKSPHSLLPIPSAENGSSGYSPMPHSSSNRDLMINPSQYPSAQRNLRSFSSVSSGSSSAASGSLSSLLNPSNSNYPPARPTITNYASSLLSMPQSTLSLSPDSRPATDHIVSSIGCPTPYDHIVGREYSSPLNPVDEEHSMHCSRSPSVDLDMNLKSSQTDFAYMGGSSLMEDGAFNTVS